LHEYIEDLFFYTRRKKTSLSRFGFIMTELIMSYY